MFDAKKGSRTLEEIIKCSQLAKKKLKYNCFHSPVFPSVPIENVVIDTLHMFLRIVDVSINLLILELRRANEIDKSTLTVFDRNKHKHCARFEDFLANIGIPGFSFYMGESYKKLKWRTLTGPDKIVLCKNIKLACHFRWYEPPSV